jgi:hypothetical protein
LTPGIKRLLAAAFANGHGCPEGNSMTETVSVYSDDTYDIYVELGTLAEPALVRWSAPRRPASGMRNEGYALLGTGGPVLLDPPAAGEAALERLLAVIGAPPQATVLTTDWHERASYRLRDLWGTPVWAPAAGLRVRGGDLEGHPDHTYEEGTPLPAGLLALRLEGRFIPAEHLLVWQSPTGSGVLFTGDAINGQAPERQSLPNDWRLAPGLYVGVGPTMFSWLADPPRLQAGLRRALAHDFDLLCGAHAWPYRERPEEALAQLLAQDWAAILLTGGRPAVYTDLLRHTALGRTSLPLVVRPTT